VLNANPLENLHHSADIAYVIKNGALYDASTMDEIWPENKPLGRFFWQRDGR
jgi:hypothetical protein